MSDEKKEKLQPIDRQWKEKLKDGKECKRVKKNPGYECRYVPELIVPSLDCIRLIELGEKIKLCDECRRIIKCDDKRDRICFSRWGSSDTIGDFMWDDFYEFHEEKRTKRIDDIKKKLQNELKQRADEYELIDEENYEDYKYGFDIDTNPFMLIPFLPLMSDVPGLFSCNALKAYCNFHGKDVETYKGSGEAYDLIEMKLLLDQVFANIRNARDEMKRVEEDPKSTVGDKLVAHVELVFAKIDGVLLDWGRVAQFEAMPPMEKKQSKKRSERG